ncbi:MAG: hypothetical protein NC489_17830, partial [Ruminococcus flavefaciens]|nr:hypothetical protein [Ruminococcus flavefaciens]
MKRKKVFDLLLVVAMCGSLIVGCGDDKGSDVRDTPSQQESTESSSPESESVPEESKEEEEPVANEGNSDVLLHYYGWTGYGVD